MSLVGDDTLVIATISKSAWLNRYLIWQMAKREIAGRYRGSVLGMAWALIYPMLMLGVYTFVFAVVFQARWGVEVSQSKPEFAIILFAGLIVFNLFAECINRAPLLVTQNVNYVKKVVFPLEVLPIVAICVALFNATISLLVLLLAQLVVRETLSATILLFPLLLVPLLLATVGVCWFLASLGVYIRDVAQVTGLFTTVMLFMSPVFYPISALPAKLQPWLFLNPLTFVLEAGRGLLIFGKIPSVSSLIAFWIVSVAMAMTGFWWFQRTRRGFADVL